MPYRLKRNYEFPHAKTGKTVKGTSYFKGWIFGCPEGSSRTVDAREFPTKLLAEVYAKNKGLRSRGYKPERIQ